MVESGCMYSSCSTDSLGSDRVILKHFIKTLSKLQGGNNLSTKQDEVFWAPTAWRSMLRAERRSEIAKGPRPKQDLSKT